MADKNWRTSPDIQLAKHVANEKRAVAAIIVWFTPDSIGTASYGRDGRICKAAGKIADEIFNQIGDRMKGVDELVEAING